MIAEYASNQAIPGTIYKVVRVLGEGAMGRVYEVEDTMLGKRYALKTLACTGSSGSQALIRLAVESRTLVRVAHPNIVNVVTAGVASDGCFYFVMELLRGASLASVLAAKRHLDVRFAVPIARSVAEALEKAHAEGVVHRDVKPENIFVSMQSNHRTAVKLVDFGISALLENALSVERDLGVFLGTPLYSSPQQQRGERAAPQMDVWSLGAVLFEMVAGRVPFPGRSIAEVYSTTQDSRPAPPLDAVAPNVSRGLARLVGAMLEKDTTRRVPAMSTVVEQLRALRATA